MRPNTATAKTMPMASPIMNSNLLGIDRVYTTWTAERLRVYTILPNV